MEIVVDLDGTLCDCRWRLPHVKEKNWAAFYAGIKDDPPVEPLLKFFQHLQTMAIESKTNYIWLVFITGRPSKYSEDTITWLNKHGLFDFTLYMRPDGDFRPDYEVKLELLNQAKNEFPGLDLAIEDRLQVAEAYKQAGMTVLEHSFGHPRGGATAADVPATAVLTLVIGPSGAGKTSWLRNDRGYLATSGKVVYSCDLGILPHHIIGTDEIRTDLTGDFKDQSRNDEVFEIFHNLIKQRLQAGLPAVADATNLRRKDRIALVNLAPAAQVRYVVINRSVESKRETGGWRNELNFDLIARHEATFQAQLKDILSGDGIYGVEVINLIKNRNNGNLSSCGADTF